MDYNQYVQGLINLGLSEREAKIYLALLNKRDATPADLQKISGLRQNIVYETIGNLARQGYCSEKKAGKKRSFNAIEPDSAFEFPIKRMEDTLQSSVNLKNDLQVLYAENADVMEPFEYIEIIHGKKHVHNSYVELIRNANKEILGFGRPPYSCDTSEKIKEQHRENMAFHDRNGKVRWVYELNSPDQEWIVPGLIEGQKRGAGFHIAEKLPLKMTIFDTREMLVVQKAPHSSDDELTIALVKHQGIVDAFSMLFEFFWEKSIELDEWISLHL
jgi:predicted transcriptional regulator